MGSLLKKRLTNTGRFGPAPDSEPTKSVRKTGKGSVDGKKKKWPSRSRKSWIHQGREAAGIPSVKKLGQGLGGEALIVAQRSRSLNALGNEVGGEPRVGRRAKDKIQRGLMPGIS